MSSVRDRQGDDGAWTPPPLQVPESTSCILVERGFLRQLRGNVYIKGISERHGKVGFSHVKPIFPSLIQKKYDPNVAMLKEHINGFRLQ